MIPKQLFFIWFGEKPNYVDFAIKNFKDVNPDFDIELIHESNPFISNNSDIKETLQLINDNNTLYYSVYNRKWAKDNYADTIYSKFVGFNDCFRIYIINKYGGIYLDCDTFPLKPFDDEIRSKCKLIVHCSNKYKSWYDSFIAGCSKGYGLELLYQHLYPAQKSKLLNNCYSLKMFNYSNYEATHKKYPDEYIQNYKDFYNCKLKRDNIKNNMDYIVHYRNVSWSKKC